MVTTFPKIIPLLHNPYLKDETLIDMNNFYDDITLNLINSINKYCPIPPKFCHIDPSKFLEE